MAAERADNLPETAETLRRKYADLARKYGVLVERMQKRTAQEVAAQSLGRWGLAATSDGLAILHQGRTVITNPRFLELTREPRWRRADAGAPGAWRTLRALLAGEVTQMPRAGTHVRLQAGDGKLLSVRLTRSSGRDGLVLVMAHDITDATRQEEELHRAREALLQQERLRMLGEAAAAVAHDLGSKLRRLA